MAGPGYKQGSILMAPGEIEKRSLEIIESEVPEPRPFREKEWLVVRRMIHTTADFDLLNLVKFHPRAIEEGINALKRGCLVITDTQMARMGITQARMDKLGCQVECYINMEQVIQKAARQGVTRTRAAVDFAVDRISGSIFVVGNAPMALMRVLDLIEQGKVLPALIVGTPVGFVNVIESKERLLLQDRIPYITVKGRKGGSALGASVVNQLALIALESNNSP